MKLQHIMFARILFFGLSLLTLACSTNTDSESVTKERVINKWTETDHNMHDVAGKKHQIQFTTDSFYLTKYEYSDLVLAQCNPGDAWNEYVKGVWALSESSLELSGIYCDASFNELQIPDCPERINTGKFDISFTEVTFQNNTLTLHNPAIGNWDGLLILQPTPD